MTKREGCGFPFFVAKQGLGQSVRHFAGAVYVHQIRKRLFAVQAEFFKACVEAQRHRQQALQARLGAVRPTGRALAEKRVFVRQLCRQSFPLRANGFSRSVRRQYALTFFRLFAPVRLLLLQYFFFRSFRPICLFSSAAPTAVPLRSDVFLRTYAVCSDVFSPVCVPPNCCFCTRPFFLLLFCRCLARKSLPINNAKTDSSQRQKTVFAVIINYMIRKK